MPGFAPDRWVEAWTTVARLTTTHVCPSGWLPFVARLDTSTPNPKVGT
jgi:hypothetical protein